MTDFFEKGFSCVDLIDPDYATATWKDLDLDQLQTLRGEVTDQMTLRLNLPRTPDFEVFIHEIDLNMYRCWERYGKKWLRPKLIGQELLLFGRIDRPVWAQGTEEHMVVWVPIAECGVNEGLPTMMLGTHLNETKNLPWIVSIPQGSALMFDARLAVRRELMRSGGVVFARTYDITGL